MAEAALTAGAVSISILCSARRRVADMLIIASAS